MRLSGPWPCDTLNQTAERLARLARKDGFGRKCLESSGALGWSTVSAVEGLTQRSRAAKRLGLGGAGGLWPGSGRGGGLTARSFPNTCAQDCLAIPAQVSCH